METDGLESTEFILLDFATTYSCVLYRYQQSYKPEV